MKINYLTTKISDTSGGAIYDRRFLTLLTQIFPNTRIIEDSNFFGLKINGNLWEANKLYFRNYKKIFDCDYLVMNSRLYTRFLFLHFILKKSFPDTRVIMIHHHSNYMTHQGILYLIHRFFESKFLEIADEVIIPNKYVIDQVKNTVNIKKVIYLPTAFDKKEFKTSSLNNKRLLFVGNVEKRKGIDLALKSFALLNHKIPEYTFAIVGKYDEKNSYFKKMIKFIKKKHLENNISFEGRVSEEQLDELYSQSDLFLFPSLHEGYGMVLIEAMGRGLPVVAFDNSAMPYTVECGVNGVLVRNRDWRILGDKIYDLLTDKKQLLKLQEGAIETYTKAETVDQLCKATCKYIQSWRKY